MNPAFQFDRYLLKRQVLALTGKFRFYNPTGDLVLFSEQKMFKLKEDIRVFADESKTLEVLQIKARQIIDFSAAYDVFDSSLGQKVGVLRRRGLLGMFLPQNYDLPLGGERVADLRQRFNLFRYELDLDFSMDSARRLDRRLGLAAGILLAAIEGKQDN
jgi:uncharacterized protein YxjI